MWYYGTYTCGHKGRVNLTGPEKYRQYNMKAEFEKLCPECYEKEIARIREEKNKKDRDEASEMKLPELEGTEEQIAWACTLRSKIIHNIMNYIDATGATAARNRLLVVKKLKDYDISITPDEVYSTLQKILNYLITTKTSSTYWIDNGENSILLSWLWISDLVIEVQEKERKIELPKEILDESLLYPCVSKYGGIVKITGDKNIHICYTKNQEFIKIMREHKLSWTGKDWTRKLTSTTGSYSDRAGEIGNHLLREGFTLSILDETARKKAVTGDIEPEHTKWVILKIIKEKPYLRIFWTDEIDDDLFQSIRRLPGATYRQNGFYIKLEYYAEVCDFTRLNGFRISEKAQAAMENYKIYLKGNAITPGNIMKKSPKETNK